MSSIKQLIINAIMKVTGENPALNVEGQVAAEEARDDFIRLLMIELFPEDPTVPATKKVKKTKKTEVVVVEKTEEVAVAVVENTVPTEVVVEIPVVQEASPKKKRGPMSEEAKASMKAKRDETLAAKKGDKPVSPPSELSVLETSAVESVVDVPAPEQVKEKKVRKPKAEKPDEDANLAKVDPTWRKHLKHADNDHVKELEPELLKYLNALSKEVFNAKKAEEHVADFLASRVPSDGKVETDLCVVEFENKEYFINPETKRVYEGEGVYDEESGWTNYKPVGYVGMAAFAEMKMDE